MTAVLPSASDARTLNRNAMLRLFASAMVLVVGMGALALVERSLNWTIDKPPMPLRKPLNALPTRFGSPVAYQQFDTDKFMNEAVVEVLGTKDYLLRYYQDMQKPDIQQAGSLLYLNLNYYATGSSTPHVPDICWAATGRTVQSDHEWLIRNVKHADGSVSDVKMRMLSFNPTRSDWEQHPELPKDAPLNVAYTFNVNGVYVAKRSEVEQQFWKAENKHAYHTKIEVTVPTRCAPDEAERCIDSFIRASLSSIEECLPDPVAANAAVAAPAAAPAAPASAE